MKSLLFSGIVVAAAGAAWAQQLAAPETIKAPPLTANTIDAAATPMLVDERDNGGFAAWYVRQRRPVMVVYFNREIADLPPGWEDGERLLIEDTTRKGKAEESRTIAIGRQEFRQSASRSRTQLGRLFEQSLSTELKRREVRLADSTILHRKLAAASRDRRTDIEYESLSRSVRFVLEVQLVTFNGETEAVAVLKDVRSGDVSVTVRQHVASMADAREIDTVSRALVQRLMRAPIS